MSTAIGLEKLFKIDSDVKPQTIGSGSGSPVFVVVTSIDHTLKALEKASQLAEPLQSRIEILAVEEVPFALPLDNPPVSSEYLVRHLEEMAARFPQPIKISAYLCRDQLEALTRVLNRNCPVVMGVRKRWWPTHDEKLARKLCSAGYNVILVETE
jgi:hypothetical protein